MQKYSKETAETLAVLRVTGFRWTIETIVDRRVELHNEVTRLNGKVEIYFVAEIDSYGNVSDWGNPDMKASKLDRRDFFLNADGEIVKGVVKK